MKNEFRASLKYWAAGCAAALSATALNAENLIFNSSFELDDCGYTLLRYIQPSNNKGMEYLKPEFVPGAPGSGKKALMIPNPYAEQIKLYSQELKLEPGTEYSFSCKAKCDASSGSFTVMFVAPTPASNWNAASKKFSVGKEWCDCSFSFKVPKDWKQPLHSVYFAYGKEADAPAIAFCFDRLQLNAGAQQQWQPKAEIEAASRFSSSYYVIPDGGSNEKAKTHIVNNTDRPLKAEISLRLVPDNSGSRVFIKADGQPEDLGSFNVELAPRESKTIERKISLSKYGFFRLETVVKGSASVASVPDYCAVIGNYDGKALDLDNVFYAGMNFPAADFSYPATSFGDVVKTSFKSTGFTLSESLDMYAKMGMRLYRDCSWCFSWACVEPEKGKFNFEEAELIASEAEKRGIAVIPTLGNSDFIVDAKRNNDWPSWVRPNCATVKKAGEWGYEVMLPPMEDWRGYIKAVASHFKGRIKRYEIVNEPNGFLNCKDYMEYLKAACEEIKSADPNAKVAGFCVTGDKGGKLEGFLGACIKEGGLNYADIVTYHPYGASQISSGIPADLSIERMKTLVDKHRDGKDVQLWDSEDFYLGDFKGDGNDRSNCLPSEVAAHFLIDLAEGVTQAPFINSTGLFKSTSSPYFESLYPWDYGHPSGNLAVFNSLARRFEGAKRIGKFKPGGDIVVYAFEKDGKPIAAIWAYGESKPVKTSLGVSDADATLYDLFGNKLPLGSGKSLLVTQSPLLLEPKSADKGAFLELLKNAKVEMEKPVSIGSARLVPSGSGWAVLVSVRNLGNEELQGKLGVNGKGLVGGAIADMEIPGGKESSFKVPVKLEVDSPVEALVKVHAFGKTWDFPVKLDAPPKTYPASRKDGAFQPLKNGDASFSASYDEKFLHLSFSVKDALPSGDPNGRDPWEQDCVEIFIDANPFALPVKDPARYTDKVARLFILPYEKEGARLAVWAPDGLKKLYAKDMILELKLSKDGYSAALSIPLDALELAAPFEGKAIGFEACVDFADGAKRDGVASWNSNGKAYSSRLLFGFITFV